MRTTANDNAPQWDMLNIEAMTSKDNIQSGKGLEI
jgi:hypothetical protein